jgi:hypothetical protein
MSHPTTFCHRLSESRGYVDPVYFITAAFRMAANGSGFPSVDENS